MLKIFQRLWQVNWAEQWQYCANLIMYLLYWLVSPIIYLAVWTSIAQSKGSVNGLTANDFTTYYMTLLIVDQITSNIVIHTFAYKVQDGSLSGELVRPIHPMLTNALVNNIAFKILAVNSCCGNDPPVEPEAKFFVFGGGDPVKAFLPITFPPGQETTLTSQKS